MAVFMSQLSKKQSVIEALEQQTQPTSLPQLLSVLGPGYAERSVRRWLTELVDSGLVIQTGQKRSTRYLIAEQKDQAQSIYFSERAQKVIASVRRPIIERKPTTYNAKWLDEYQPNKDAYVPKSIQQKLFQAGDRSKNHELAGTYARLIYNRLLIDLSYNSSRLEGNTYSLLDTKKLLLEGDTVEGKLDEEKIMILNHKEAIKYLVENIEKIKINKVTVNTIHYLLSDGLVAATYGGSVRDYGVRIGSSSYIPLENPSQLEAQIQLICQKAASIENPFEKSFFLLVHIAYLQAFADVNKRTARICCNIPLLKNNLVPLSFNDIEKEDYISAMVAIYELNNVQPLLELYEFSYLRTCTIYDATIEAIGIDETRVRYRETRRQIIREIILKRLVGSEMNEFIDKKTRKLIKAEDQADFLRNLKDDISQLAPHSIVGLGISQDELKKWLKKRSQLNEA